MLTVFFRTFIIYISLIIVMRLMGKRQLGELEISDLGTTFLISEIASLPITDSEIPLTHAIIPIIVLLSLEVGISAFLSKFPKLKFIFSARPSTLIKDGELCKKALLDSRISFDELFTQLRQQGCDDISQIKYAILEQNGKITVVQKAEFKTVTAAQLNIKTEESGISHIVVCEGKINKNSLKTLSLSKSDIEKELKKRNIALRDVYIMMVDDAKNVQIIKKED